MSEWGGILDAALAHAVTAVPGLTAERKLVALERIPADRFPHVSGYILDTGAALVAGGYLQETREIAAQLLFRFKGETQEATYAHFDAVRTRLYTDRTLAGLVRRLFVSGATPREDPASGVISLAVVVLCERVV